MSIDENSEPLEYILATANTTPTLIGGAASKTSYNVNETADADGDDHFLLRTTTTYLDPPEDEGGTSDDSTSN